MTADPADALRAALRARCNPMIEPDPVDRLDREFLDALHDHGIVRFRLLTLTVEDANGSETDPR